MCIFNFLETWILYLGKKQGISKVVRDAYRNYEDIEFKTRAAKNKINNPDRHVKLINLAGKKVWILSTDVSTCTSIPKLVIN